MPFGSFLENFLSNVSTLPQGLAATNEEPIWTRLTCQRFQTLMRPEPGIMIRAPQLAETESDFGWTLMLLIVLPKQRPPSAVFQRLKVFLRVLIELVGTTLVVRRSSFVWSGTYAIAALHLEEVNSKTTTRYLNLVISLPFVYISGCMQIGTIVRMLQVVMIAELRSTVFSVDSKIGGGLAAAAVDSLSACSAPFSPCSFDAALVVVTRRILANHNTFS